MFETGLSGGAVTFGCRFQGWLTDLLNKFGRFGGFQAMLDRFEHSEKPLNTGLVCALLK